MSAGLGRGFAGGGRPGTNAHAGCFGGLVGGQARGAAAPASGITVGTVTPVFFGGSRAVAVAGKLMALASRSTADLRRLELASPAAAMRVSLPVVGQLDADGFLPTAVLAAFCGHVRSAQGPLLIASTVKASPAEWRVWGGVCGPVA